MGTYLKKYNIFIIIGFFIVLYNPPILTFNAMHLVGLISITYLVINRVTKIESVYYTWIIYFLTLFCYLLINILVHNRSFSGSFYPIYYLVDIIPFARAISLYYKKNKLTIDDLWSVIFFTALIQSFMAFIAFVNPEIQSIFVQRIIDYGGIESYYYWSTLRMYGFSNGLMFEMPVLQSVLAIIALYFGSVSNKKYFILASVLFFSAIINARVSFVVFMLGVLSIILFNKQSLKKKVTIIGGILFILILLIVIVFPYIQEHAPLTYLWILNGLDDLIGVINLNTSEGYFSYVTNLEKYRLPESDLGLLFGEGIVLAGGNNPFRVASDLGFINDIWVGGFLYVALEYYLFFRNITLLLNNKNSMSSFLVFFLIPLVAILDFKGRVFSMNGFMNFIIIIHILLIDINLKVLKHKIILKQEKGS